MRKGRRRIYTSTFGLVAKGCSGEQTAAPRYFLTVPCRGGCILAGVENSLPGSFCQVPRTSFHTPACFLLIVDPAAFPTSAATPHRSTTVLVNFLRNPGIKEQSEIVPGVNPSMGRRVETLQVGILGHLSTRSEQ